MIAATRERGARGRRANVQALLCLTQCLHDSAFSESPKVNGGLTPPLWREILVV